MALTKEEREVLLKKPLTLDDHIYLVDRIEDAEATIDRLINALVAVVRVDPDSLAAEIADAAVNYKKLDEFDPRCTFCGAELVTDEQRDLCLCEGCLTEDDP